MHGKPVRFEQDCGHKTNFKTLEKQVDSLQKWHYTHKNQMLRYSEALLSHKAAFKALINGEVDQKTFTVTLFDTITKRATCMQTADTGLHFRLVRASNVTRRWQLFIFRNICESCSDFNYGCLACTKKFTERLKTPNVLCIYKLDV